MKFSKKLQYHMNQKLGQHYLSYRELKKAIKLITGSDTSSYTINEVTSNFGNIKALSGSVYRPSESRFMDLLNHELDKINSFSSIKFNEIKDSLKSLQEHIQQLTFGQVNDEYGLSQVNDGNEMGIILNNSITVELLEDIISPIVEQLDKRGEDLVFLDNYQRLNFTGFRKITKKYDKINKSSSSSWYLARLVREPFMNMNLNMLLESLSFCYEQIEELKVKIYERVNSANSAKDEEEANSLFQSSLELHSKHLILPDDIMKVKVLLLKTAPLFSIGLLRTHNLSESHGNEKSIAGIGGEKERKESNASSSLPDLPSNEKLNILPTVIIDNKNNVKNEINSLSPTPNPLNSLVYSYSPKSSLNSQRCNSTGNQMSALLPSNLTLQTTTVSYLYFDNEEYAEYHRILSIRKRLSHSSFGSSGTYTTSLNNKTGDSLTRANSNHNKYESAYPNFNEELIPKEYQDHTFRLRWYGENEGSPEQWLNLDWVHPTEPCFSVVEWFDPRLTSKQEQTAPEGLFEDGSVQNRTKFPGKSRNLNSRTMLIQQKDVYHILKTYGNLKRRSRNPMLVNKFNETAYLNEPSLKGRLTKDQVLLLKCFIEFIKYRKLGPFIHLCFNRTSFISASKGIYVHIDSNWKIVPEMDENRLLNENELALGDNNNDIGDTADEHVMFNEIAINSLSTSMKLSMMYNTCIVSPQTEAMVSENIKAIPQGIMSVSIINSRRNGNSSFYTSPREMLKDIFGLASVSEVTGFSNIETCTALLYSHRLKQVPHWFNYMIIESENQQETNNSGANSAINDSNSDSQSLSGISSSKFLNSRSSINRDNNNKANPQIDANKAFTLSSGNLDNPKPVTSKIDVLHTGNNSRIIHDQEATAQREANLLLGNELQNSSILSSFESSATQKSVSNLLLSNNIAFSEKKQAILPPHSLSISLLDGEYINRESTDYSNVVGNNLFQRISNSIENSRIFRSLMGMCRIGKFAGDSKVASGGGPTASKKINVTSTVRVEPKTFFANERTLLQWMNMAVLLATISISLLSFGTQIGQICGVIMAPVAIFFIGYSYYIYIKRNKALEKKEYISYSDKFGPTLLVFCLIVSLTSVLLLNIIVGSHSNKSFVKIREGGNNHVDYINSFNKSYRMGTDGDGVE